MNRHPRPVRRASGFTLVELAFAVVVLTVLSGTVVGSMSWLRSARENVTATRVRTVLVFAQEWAMGSGNRTWVDFNVASDLVSVHVEDPLNPGKANRQSLLDPLTRKSMTLQLGEGGVGIDAVDMDGTSEVEFDPGGAPHDAGGNLLTADGTVAVTGGGLVQVTRGTGLVTVL